MFDSIVLIQFKNKKQNKKLEFEVQHLMIFTYFFLWITFLMKSEKITLCDFWQTLNNLRHRSYFGYPCYFELFPNDALSVDYSKPRQAVHKFTCNWYKSICSTTFTYKTKYKYGLWCSPCVKIYRNLRNGWVKLCRSVNYKR